MIQTIIHQHFRTKEAAKRAANTFKRVAPKAYITIRRGTTVYFRLQGTLKETERLMIFFQNVIRIKREQIRKYREKLLHMPVISLEDELNKMMEEKQ